MLKIELIGNIGKNAVSQKINEKNYAKFSMAVKIDKDKTEWVDCLKIDKEGKLTPYLTAGKTIFVDGRPSANAYTNKEGKVIGSLNVWVNELEFVASPKAHSEAQTEGSPSEGEDDLPY